MKILSRSALALCLSLAATGAYAADCRVNFVVNNPTAYRVTVFVETRTRANMSWYDGGLSHARVRDRWTRVDAGQRSADTLTMPIVGCAVRRELRVRVECYDMGAPFRYISTQQVLPWGSGLQRPRDVNITARC